MSTVAVPSVIADQARQATEYLTTQYSNGNELIVGVAAILEDLVPDPDPVSVPNFEQAMHDLGLHLGLGAQRPERDTREGPDVRWSLGELTYLVIECNSGSTSEGIWRHDAEQLSHSMDWFDEKYDHTSSATPVLIHNTDMLHRQASARPGTKIITFDKLAKLREAGSKYAAALAADNDYRDASKVSAHWRRGASTASRSSRSGEWRRANPDCSGNYGVSSMRGEEGMKPMGHLHPP
jgi:hypothetical protein